MILQETTISLQDVDDDAWMHSESAISFPVHVTPVKERDGWPLFELDETSAEAKPGYPSCLQATAP
jgi:hypothetical protein